MKPRRPDAEVPVDGEAVREERLERRLAVAAEHEGPRRGEAPEEVADLVDHDDLRSRASS